MFRNVWSSGAQAHTKEQRQERQEWLNDIFRHLFLHEKLMITQVVRLKTEGF
jgi:hypothetical protein